MTSILAKLQSEYGSEYYPKKRMKYTTPKIYSGGKSFDLSKRWYVYYSYVDPQTNVMTRQPPIYYKINREYKTKHERLRALKDLKKDIETLLKEGYSPYASERNQNIQYTVKSALEYGLSIKIKEVQESTYRDYEQRINNFIDYINKKTNIKSITDVDKKVVSNYLNSFSGSKNSNNTKAALSSIFTVLSDDGIIKYNFIKELRNKKVRKKAKRIFTEKEIDDITKLLEAQDKSTLLYVQLISFMFWRPVEIVRLDIKNIDFDKNIMRVNTKGKDFKTKIIPSILIDNLKAFIGNRKGKLFILKAKKDADKRSTLTERFARFRDKNNIDKELTPYHFRHTYITKIYLILRKTKSKEESIKELSLITGHESKAIYEYIHVNDIELPDDYSKYLK